MSGVFFLIEWLATPLYILMAAAILWYGYRFIRARQEIRATYFELERDISRRRQANAITAIILAIEICVVILGVQLRAVPFLEAERDLEGLRDTNIGALPQDGIFVTPTSPSVVENTLNLPEGTPLGGNSDVGFVSTPTLTPTPVGTIIPNPPAIQGCTDERAFLQIPANGMRVFQPITVRGTAFVEGFSTAKIEISGPTTNNQYWVVDTRDTPVTTLSDFSQFIPAQFEPGLYQFRLTVFDSNTDLRATCMVNIFISAPPVTPTPTATPSS